MTEIFTLLIIGVLTYAAWQDRAQVLDDWTLLITELAELAT